MKTDMQTIELVRLAVAFAPPLLVIAVLYKWSLGAGSALYAMGRMLVQLLAIGYVLGAIFKTRDPLLVTAVLAGMLLLASWIALRAVAERRSALYWRMALSLAVGGIATLALVVQGVLALDPWFAPQTVIPLAGMIFANAMNTVALAAERFQAERDRGAGFESARNSAFGAALIPIVNSLLAVGLISFPGMMTGQILSGVSPLVAARYQIMVMCMIFGAAGLSTACYLSLQRR